MIEIASVEAIPLDIPFDDPVGDLNRIRPRGWKQFDMVLVKVTSADGLVGWGESFAYQCRSATLAAVRDMVAPLVVGRRLAEPADVSRLCLELQKKLHIQGRYGITTFAISGLDIALWDLSAKRAEVPLAQHLGGFVRRDIPAYASLIRYAEPRDVATAVRRARADGFDDIKLHEVTFEACAAARHTMGPDARLTIDANCAWDEAQAEVMIERLAPLKPMWVEEPVFPPENWDAQRRLSRFGVPIAAGENACTAIEFERLAKAVTYPQPSVIKVGGITECLAIADIARAAQRTLMPHSPYFGPGYWATLHLMAHRLEFGLFEHLFVNPAASVGVDPPRPKAGKIAVPDGTGLGFVPDHSVIARYTV